MTTPLTNKTQLELELACSLLIIAFAIFFRTLEFVFFLYIMTNGPMTLMVGLMPSRNVGVLNDVGNIYLDLRSSKFFTFF